ncbi:MAG: porin [Nevskiales bacterium]|nr:porin [Nevskiales bacterium]
MKPRWQIPRARAHCGAALALVLASPLHAAETQDATPTAASAPTIDLEALRDAVRQQQQTIDQQQERIDALVDQIEHVEKEASATGPGKLSWEGYGVINYQRYDFYENSQDDTAESRARTDLERIVLAPTYDFGNGYAFVAEIEFEHGGTGATVEFEQEEAGEFETEVEKGGEVVLEQAHLQIEVSPWLNWRLGEIVVPFGMVNTHHQPSQYFTLERSLAETSLIASVWHETGVELYGAVGQLRYQLQVVTALDSSGFSGPEFVRGGMQGRLEFDNADDLAVVGRADYSLAPGVLLGGAVYYGDSAGNRPRKNLDVSAAVTLLEVHGRYERGPLIVRGQYISGTIENADEVTRANYTTYNAGELGISKTPVGSKAVAYFVEAGYDVMPLFGRSRDRLDVFARYDAYDTHADTEGTIVEVARYDREAITAGLNYQPMPGIVFKAEYSQREHAGTTGNEQEVYGLGLGFEF